jgi:hypothetical protein
VSAIEPLRVPVVLVFDTAMIRESYDNWCASCRYDGEAPNQTWDEWLADWVNGCITDAVGGEGMAVERA